jgi:hypothetical protein
MENNCIPTFWTTGHLPNGAKVSFTIPITDLNNAYGEALAFTSKLLADGFMLSEPGLEAGELREQVGYMVRRQKKNEDGTYTPVIDLYLNNDRTVFKFLSVYLNSEDEIRAYEAASGIKLVSMTLLPGKASVERNDEEQAKYIVKAPAPFNVVFKLNPQYDPNSDEKKPKRLFERWEGANNVLPLDTQENAGNRPSDAITEDSWTETDVKLMVNHYAGKLTVQELLAALNVKRFGEWTQGKKAAYVAIEAFNQAIKEAF